MTRTASAPFCAPAAGAAQAQVQTPSGGNAVSRPGRSTGLAGGSGGVRVRYLPPAPTDFGREAWLVGDGEAEVVHCRPRQPIEPTNKRAAASRV